MFWPDISRYGHIIVIREVLYIGILREWFSGLARCLWTEVVRLDSCNCRVQLPHSLPSRTASLAWCARNIGLHPYMQREPPFMITSLLVWKQRMHTTSGSNTKILEFRKLRSNNLRNPRDAIGVRYARMQTDCESYGNDRAILKTFAGSQSAKYCMAWVGSKKPFEARR